jgi:1,4-dihydroxy-2-naphthoate octaprenyltransferase
MRMSFHWLLAPLFLWGFALAGAPLSAGALLGFVALHLFLYPGATAFNGAYDRDSGPVSGLDAPPPVPPGLLAFSLALQLAGAALAAAAGAAFLLVYLLIALVFVGYSHPLTRWKARPLASALAVAVGQGALGVVAGWAAATGALPPLTGLAAAGVFAGALTTLGLYPSTQIFQVEEDSARRDRTLAVALGPAGALRLGALCLALAAPAAVFATHRLASPLESVLAVAAYILLILRHLTFAPVVERQPPDALYGWAAATRWTATAAFLGFLALLILRGP